jgi:hypothetical protein
MRVSQAMQPIARLVDELRTSAVANLVIGDAAMVAAAFRADSPGRAVVLFAVVTGGLALVSGRFGPNGRIRRDLVRAPHATPGSVIEPLRATRRRVIIGLVPVAAILAVLVGVAPESAAVIAGVPAGVGSGDMWMLGWLTKFEGDRGDTALREVGSSPFVATNRPVYTLPMNAETDAT